MRCSYGSDDLRLAETVDVLRYADDATSLVAWSTRPMADRWLQAVDLRSGRVVCGPPIAQAVVGRDRVLAVPDAEPTVVRAFSLPDLGTLGEWSLPSEVRSLAVADRVAVGLDSAVVLLDGPTFPVAQPPTALRFSPDGSQLAIGTESGAVSVMELASGRVRALGSCRSALTVLAWSDDGAWIGAAGKSGWVFPTGGGKGRKIATPKHWAWVLGFSPAGDVLLCFVGEKLAAIAPATGGIVWEVPQYGPAVFRGSRGVVGRFEELHELDAATGAEVRRWTAPSIHVAALDLGPDGAIALAETRTTRLSLADRAGWRPVPDGHGGRVQAVHFAADGRFATGASDGRLCVWRRGGEAIHALALADDVGAVHLAGDTLWIGVGHRVFRWRDGTLAESASLEAPVRALLPLPSGPVVVACEASRSRRGQLALLDPETLEVGWSERIHWSVTQAGLRPDGQVTLTGGLSSGVLDPVGRTLSEDPPLTSVDYGRRTLPTPDRRVLVEADSRPAGGGRYCGQIHATETETGRVLYQHLDEEELSGGLALDPGGTRLATAHIDGRIRIWDVASGALLSAIPDRPVAALWWFPDGRSLLVAERNGALREVAV